MSTVPTKESDKAANVIGDLAETVYQVDRASHGKPYKPMGYEEVVEPVGKWVAKIRGPKVSEAARRCAVVQHQLKFADATKHSLLGSWTHCVSRIHGATVDAFEFPTHNPTHKS